MSEKKEYRRLELNDRVYVDLIGPGVIGSATKFSITGSLKDSSVTGLCVQEDATGDVYVLPSTSVRYLKVLDDE